MSFGCGHIIAKKSAQALNSIKKYRHLEEKKKHQGSFTSTIPSITYITTVKAYSIYTVPLRCKMFCFIASVSSPRPVYE